MPNIKNHPDLEFLRKRRDNIKHEIQLLEMAIMSMEFKGVAPPPDPISPIKRDAFFN
ncbi:hypothetical protein [Olivibacter domesticus]|uniref:hypothetical protein n=1 Tax=Olivibacter domesticus TaxID=407022 RepID=UPI00138FF3CE|nr:hypothetical protein [Olivibacter domesticus]